MIAIHRQRNAIAAMLAAASLIGTAALGMPAAWAQAGSAADPHAGHVMPPPNETPDPHAGHAESAPAMQGGNLAESSSNAARESRALAESPMDMDAMQGGSPPEEARDPHAYRGGQEFGPYTLHLADAHKFKSFRAENLETTRAAGTTTTAFDIEAWYGGTYDRAVLKSEGKISSGELADARTELHWSHAFAPFWNRQVGVRYDSGDGPNRTWLAVGVQGLAPYWFELEATAYVGDGSRTALRFDASYDLLLTQRLILQPGLEANFYGQRDRERGLGSGLTEAIASLRLRYEIRRELAPYVGVEWLRQYGETKDLARAAGEDPTDARLVVGLRFWF